MKKCILILMVLFLNTSLFAKKGEGWIGLKGGLNFATVSTDYTNFSPKTLQAYNAGIVLGGLMGQSNVFFEMNFLYSVKGWSEDFTAQGITATAKTQINYLEWPVNFGYRFNIGDNFHLSPYAGFYSAYALSGKETGEAVANGKKVSLSEDLSIGVKDEDYFSWDLGANLGLNVEYKNIQLSAKYAYGIMGVENKSTLNSGYIRNNVISLSVAYLLRIKKKA